MELERAPGAPRRRDRRIGGRRAAAPARCRCRAALDLERARKPLAGEAIGLASGRIAASRWRARHRSVRLRWQARDRGSRDRADRVADRCAGCEPLATRERTRGPLDRALDRPAPLGIARRFRARSRRPGEAEGVRCRLEGLRARHSRPLGSRSARRTGARHGRATDRREARSREARRTVVHDHANRAGNCTAIVRRHCRRSGAEDGADGRGLDRRRSDPDRSRACPDPRSQREPVLQHANRPPRSARARRSLARTSRRGSDAGLVRLERREARSAGTHRSRQLEARCEAREAPARPVQSVRDADGLRSCRWLALARLHRDDRERDVRHAHGPRRLPARGRWLRGRGALPAELRDSALRRARPAEGPGRKHHAPGSACR